MRNLFDGQKRRGLRAYSQGGVVEPVPGNIAQQRQAQQMYNNANGPASILPNRVGGGGPMQPSTQQRTQQVVQQVSQPQRGTPSRQYGLSFARKSGDRALDRGLRAQQLGIAQERNDIVRQDGILGRIQSLMQGAGAGQAAPQEAIESTSTQIGMPSGLPAGVVRDGNSFGDAPVQEPDPAAVAAARGGKINGPGTAKSDSIPAYLSDGEYVLPAETVNKIGTGKLNNLVRQTTGDEPGPSVKKGLRGFNAGGYAHPWQKHRDSLAAKGGLYAQFRPEPATDAMAIDATTGAAPVAAAPVAPAQPNGIELADRDTAPAFKAPLNGIELAEQELRAPAPAPARAPAPQGILGAPPAPKNEAEWRQQQAAADTYRKAWQERAPGGMHNADDDAITLYNAENYTRGTGVQATRQANGVMEYSDRGLRRTPQHLGANGTPTNDWSRTSQYRDAMMRNAMSDNPALQRQGMMGLARIAADNQAEVRGRSTGNAAFDKRRAAGVPDDLNATMLQRETANDLAERQHALRGAEVAYQNTPTQADANTASEQRLARLDKQIDRIGPLDDKDRGAFRSFIAENFGDQIFDLSPEEQAVAIEKLFPQFAARQALVPFIVSGQNNRSAPRGLRKDSFGLFDDEGYANRPAGWKRLMSNAGDIMELEDGSRVDMIGLRAAVKGHPMEAEILKQFEIAEQ